MMINHLLKLLKKNVKNLFRLKIKKLVDIFFKISIKSYLVDKKSF